MDNSHIKPTAKSITSDSFSDITSNHNLRSQDNHVCSFCKNQSQLEQTLTIVHSQTDITMTNFLSKGYSLQHKQYFYTYKLHFSQSTGDPGG